MPGCGRDWRWHRRWGQGIGRSLLREALGRLTHSEWEDVTLWVGFRLDGEIRSHQPSGVPTARMRLPLGDTL